MRRVVVTGLGLVTPLGGDVETTWQNLIAGKSGIGPITRFDTSDQKAKIAGEVKPKDHPFGFDPDKRVDHKVQRQVDPFIIYAIDAAGQALEDAGLTEMDDDLKERTGVSIGSGIGGLPGIESESLVLAEKGPGRVSPHFVHGRLINLTSGQVSIKYGLMGPNHSVVTACSTGAHSIGDAARMIKDGDADIMLAGGAESTINPLGVAGFAQARALNMSFNDRPEQASRPYDKGRDGHYNLISALHKSVRGSDPDASLYWLCRMLDGGEDRLFIARRLVRMAVEDIGLADPQALVQAIAAKDTFDFLGSPEGELALAQATIYLATAPKSNGAYVAYKAAMRAAKEHGSLAPPKIILNAPTKLMKNLGYGAGYQYDHDAEGGFSGQNYFPDDMAREQFYQPKDTGFEREIAKRLEYWSKLRAKRGGEL